MKPTNVGLNLVSERVGLGQGKNNLMTPAWTRRNEGREVQGKIEKRKKDEDEEGALFSGYPRSIEVSG